MGFGYIPHRTRWKDAFLRMVGYPLLIRRLQAPVIMRMLNPAPPHLVLDAGCGGGYFTFEIARKSFCVGLDVRIGKNAPLSMQRLPRVFFVEADVLIPPFREGTFDRILLSSVLQMVVDDRNLLTECHRILKNGGELVLSVPETYRYFRKLNALKGNLNKRFGAAKGYYDGTELVGLLEAHQFNVLEVEHAPKRLGSLFYELQLLLQVARVPLPELLMFFLFYPLAFLDRFDRRDAKGCELIIRARAVRKKGTSS